MKNLVNEEVKSGIEEREYKGISREVLVDPFIISEFKNDNFFMKKDSNKIGYCIARNITKILVKFVLENECTELEREAYKLKYVKNLTTSEISDRLVTTNTYVRQLIHSCNKKINKIEKYILEENFDWIYLYDHEQY